MRTRKPIKVASATATGVTKHTTPTAFREGKIRAILTELGMDVREYLRLSAIRRDIALLNANLSH